MQINQPKDIKLKMRDCKLRSDVNWQGVKAVRCKTSISKTRPGYIVCYILVGT